MATRYFVSSVEASTAFYVDRLGFKVKQQMAPAIAILERGSDELWIAGPPASASRPMPDGSVPTPGGWNRIVVQVDDLEESVKSLREVGCKFRNDPISGPGGSQVLIEDPDGNPIELFQPRS